MAEQIPQSGLENTLFSLLEKGGGPEMNQANLLILMSLVNLMGIISLLGQRTGGRGSQEEKPARK